MRVINFGDPIDGRLNVDVEFRPVTLPGEIRQRLFALMDALQLRCANVDRCAA